MCYLLALAMIITLFSSNLLLRVQAEELGVEEEKVISAATLEDDFADDRVLVVLSNKASLDFKSFGTRDFSEVNCAAVRDLNPDMGQKAKAAVEKRKSASVLSRLAGTASVDESIEKYHQILCIDLKEKGKDKVLAAIQKLQAREDVLCVEPDYALKPCTTTANDTLYSQQWALPKIDIPSAWDYTTGSSTVKVGVLDTGIDSTHEDLCNRVNVNLSRDFVTGQAIGANTTDGNGHGTAVAGVIGAQGNNGKGITGVCQNVTMVSLRVINESGVGYVSSVISAINFADSINIRILNLSAGWHSNEQDITGNMGLSLETTIDNYNGLFICSAGNEGADNSRTAYYPSQFALLNMICVGASTQSDEIRSSSNYGRYTVNLFAPGVSIRTTSTGGGYINGEETSIATPHVTGVAALLLSLHPELTTTELRQAILTTVEKPNVNGSNPFNNKCTTNGRLNAYKAITSPIIHNYSPDRKTATGHTCDTCTYVQAHDYDTIYQYNTQKHKLVCSFCGYYIYENHCMSIGLDRCLVCGFTTNGSGVLSWRNDSRTAVCTLI